MSLFFGKKFQATTSGATTTNLNLYTIHTFTSSGTFTPTISGMVDILLIGSGGSSGTTNLPLNFPTTHPGYSYVAGGGAGATVLRKFLPVAGGNPYPVTVGTVGGSTVFGGFVSAAGGGNGSGVYFYAPNAYYGSNGTPAPQASGGGGSYLYSGTAAFLAGTQGGGGANVYGLGFPGSITAAGGGGGAGGAASGNSGGPGVPITFTGSPFVASVGGNGWLNAGNPTVPSASPGYGSGGSGPGNRPLTPIAVSYGRPGVAYIKYL